MEDSPLDLPSPDPIVALQVVGEGWELALSPAQHNFALGTLEPPAVDLSLPGKTYVSERHAYLSRRGEILTVTDNRSRNGTFHRGYRRPYCEITAGSSFRVADVRLLALNEHLRILRKHLLWCLGFDAHAQVDQALEDLADAESPGVLLVGPRDCDQRALAEAIHQTSARRHHAFVVAEPPLRTRAEEVATLRRARSGTLLLDLDTVEPLAFFVEHLFGPTYHVRPIIAAQSTKQAEDKLGRDHARRLRPILTLPAVAERRDDIEPLLDGLLKLDGCPFRIRDVGEKNLDALVHRHRWRRNFVDLRETARRCRALLETWIQADAAERLAISGSTLSEWLATLGMSWPPPGERPSR